MTCTHIDRHLPSTLAIIISIFLLHTHSSSSYPTTMLGVKRRAADYLDDEDDEDDELQRRRRHPSQQSRVRWAERVDDKDRSRSNRNLPPHLWLDENGEERDEDDEGRPIKVSAYWAS